ncbi:GAD-like domain-containing protein [Labrys sp. KB_33_2]|uniref:GAD-like domain-containing protein n=1 Tax=unclassified Labrys (in: a-proteobacteria) TaxID=2688601 RepID=UPI003EB9CD54
MRTLVILLGLLSLGLLSLLVAPRPGFAQDRPKEFQTFLTDFPPGKDVHPFRGELSPALKEHVHPRLIEFWQRVGFGSFGNGFITFFDPRDAETMLARWLLLQHPDPTRVPIARTAFGDLIYFRDLRQRAAENGLPADWKTGSDVIFLSIHYRGSSAITWSVDDFFAKDLKGFLQENPKAFHQFYSTVGGQPLAPGECFYFVPALALGGQATKKSVGRGDCLVHQEILLQLALSSGPSRK